MRKLITISFILFALAAHGQYPGLILTKEGVRAMRSELGQIPLFDLSVQSARADVDAQIELGIDVPIPKDMAGGYTHERHKANFFTMQKAGVLFQITQEEKYAEYIRDMLLAYAKMYPTIGKHPEERSYARGKFFWQCLNDANWLVYTSQAYDCIYDWIDVETRDKLNKELFRPYAEYISIENPQFFNRIHNHSTWGNAGVGMIGLVMDDQELVDWALYGLDIEVPGDFVKDNDGGAIQLEGQKESGFFAQLDHAFSPDGYYTEGPYYQRYAMYPFLIFAQGLANKKPDLGILDYRNGLLIKAVYALIDQTNSAGEFFPINDSQKGMSLASRELVIAVSMAYHYGGNDSQLLSLIEAQGRIPLNDSGLSAAEGIAEGLAEPYVFRSVELSDGANGDEGAIGILRNGDLTLMMKYAKHGMGHGHFDRLGFLLYDGADEVIQDYGAARWVNIDHKYGGGYLKENQTWAKQTIAHNALVVNRTTQFEANVKAAEESSGEPYFFDASNGKIQVMSAQEPTAYEGVTMQRTMAVLEIEELENPLILDLLSVENSAQSNYDLPFYYKGELMSTNVPIATKNVLEPMGDENGYQHLWTEGVATANEGNLQMTWFNGAAFRTVTMATRSADEVLFTRIGANDPNFNLRRDPGMILRRTGDNTVFAQAYEIHGSYRYPDEIPINSFSSIAAIEVLEESKEYTAVGIELKSGAQFIFCVSNSDSNSSTNHYLEINDKRVEWSGPFIFKKAE